MQRPTRQGCEEHFRERNCECMASVIMLCRLARISIQSSIASKQEWILILGIRDDSMMIQ